MATPIPGRVVVISGPSGAGKTTVVKDLFQVCRLPLEMAVSATTRPPRPGEVDGVDYHFWTAERFEEGKKAGEFLEFFEVFGRGYWYGTLWSEIAPRLAAGKWVVLEVDVHGAKAVAERYPAAITIFLHPGSLAELERRLRGRNTETEAAIKSRLEAAQRELAEADFYQYQVVNDTKDHAVRDIDQILQAAGERT